MRLEISYGSGFMERNCVRIFNFIMNLKETLQNIINKNNNNIQKAFEEIDKVAKGLNVKDDYYKTNLGLI
jgi:hypothetical protein